MDKPLRVRGGKQVRGIRSINGAAEQAHRQAIRKEIAVDANKLIPHTSTTAHLPEGGIYKYGDIYSIRQEYDPIKDRIVETPINDNSLGARLLLDVFPQRPTGKILIRGQQLVHKEGCTYLSGPCSCKVGTRKLVRVTDEKVTGMSETTLLSRGNPFAAPTDIHRETSRSKRIDYHVDDDLVSRETNRQDRQAENEDRNGVDLDSLMVAVDNNGKPPTIKGKRSSGVIMGSKQQRKDRKSKSK